jgi:hypothetical protein
LIFFCWDHVFFNILFPTTKLTTMARTSTNGIPARIYLCCHGIKLFQLTLLSDTPIIVGYLFGVLSSMGIHILHIDPTLNSIINYLIHHKIHNVELSNMDERVDAEKIKNDLLKLGVQCPTPFSPLFQELEVFSEMSEINEAEPAAIEAAASSSAVEATETEAVEPAAELQSRKRIHLKQLFARKHGKSNDDDDDDDDDDDAKDNDTKDNDDKVEHQKSIRKIYQETNHLTILTDCSILLMLYCNDDSICYARILSAQSNVTGNNSPSKVTQRVKRHQVCNALNMMMTNAGITNATRLVVDENTVNFSTVFETGLHNGPDLQTYTVADQRYTTYTIPTKASPSVMEAFTDNTGKYIYGNESSMFCLIILISFTREYLEEIKPFLYTIMDFPQPSHPDYETRELPHIIVYRVENNLVTNIIKFISSFTLAESMQMNISMHLRLENKHPRYTKRSKTCAEEHEDIQEQQREDQIKRRMKRSRSETSRSETSSETSNPKKNALERNFFDDDDDDEDETFFGRF